MIAQLDKEYIKTRPSKVWSRMVSYSLFEGRPLTTKGRWINPLVFGVLKTFAALPSTRQVDRPIFILGTGRSGSTILGKVLSMHKDLAFLNEPKAMWALLNKEEDLMGSYNLNAGRYRISEAEATNSVIKRANRIFGGALLMSGQRRFVDKYPELIFRTPFVSKIFPDARYIFLTRNVDSTCSSISYWSERKGTESSEGKADWWGLNNRKWDAVVNELVPEHADLAEHKDEILVLSEEGRAAVEWVVTMREGLRLCEQSPESCIHIPYDKLCGNSADWSKKLADFLQLSHDPVFDDYSKTTLVEPARHNRVALPSWLRTITDDIEKKLESVK